ncbi:hypothetical protein AB0M12_42280 [Nocardia vinacea]|uniref:hypothetical protein n=1 Tax=Nocardia vinacea TaxID=96468 RepID=UPI003445884E
MTTFTLRFDVPDDQRHIFDHEIGLALDAMEPLRKWLARNGGHLQQLVDGKPVAIQ